jgi:hypothetical protein
MSTDTQPALDSAATGERPWGLLAEYKGAEELLHAAKGFRDKGFTKWDVHSPYPIHGMDAAMGLKDSVLGWIVLVCGATGLANAIFLQVFANVGEIATMAPTLSGYSLNIGGKPYASWPAFVPIMFEMMVLFSAFGALLGMLALNRLPRWHNPLFNVKAFEAFSDDKFFLSVDASDPLFSESAVRELMQSNHAEVVLEVRLSVPTRS